MALSHRPFCGETDLRAMIALAHVAPDANLHIVDLPYRLSSWALDDPANVGLWIDGEGQLRGWVVMQTPFWTIDYVCHPAVEAELHPRILAWTVDRAHQAFTTASGHPCWFAMAFADQAARIRDLEAAGFACQADVGEDSWSKVLLRRSGRLPATGGTLPAGFSIRPLAGEPEVAAYVALHQAVFESKNMTTGWRSRTLHPPAYRPDLDLVAVAPAGRLAAFCIAWLAATADGDLVGQIEPLGVHADFHQLGLGRAILAENLRRLARAGATQVYVETDRERNAALALYQAAGFRPLRQVLVYRRDTDRY